MTPHEPIESAKHAQVTIRHARHALELLVKGAIRDIETRYGDTEECNARVVELFDNLTEQLQGWELDTTWIAKAEALISDMRRDIGKSTLADKLLARHGLLV